MLPNATVVAGLNLAPEFTDGAARPGDAWIRTAGWHARGIRRALDAAPKPFRSRQCRPPRRYRAGMMLTKAPPNLSPRCGLTRNLRPAGRPASAASRQLTVSQPVRNSAIARRQSATKPHFAALYAVIGSSVIIRCPSGCNRIWLMRPAAVHHCQARAPEPAPTQEKTVHHRETGARRKPAEKPVKKLIPPRLSCLLPKRPRGEMTTPKHLRIFRRPLTPLPEKGTQGRDGNDRGPPAFERAFNLHPKNFPSCKGRLSGRRSTTCYPRKCCWANGCERAIPRQP